MDETYSYRPYKPGDETAINELYYKVTGRRRTASQFAWQWLEAPEGPGDMWLIEAIDKKGNVKLIGHHGVMPVAFSDGQKDFLFGKTENTMVLPDYRQKILYPRFEKKFIKAYHSRYDALFSTMGPSAAIRQRKAMGYEFPVEWYSARHSTKGLFTELLFVGSLLFNKIFKSSVNSVDAKKKLLKNGFLSADDAIECSFFNVFWDQAKDNFGIAPRRNKHDLMWRFWNNPYKDYLTLIVDEGYASGYCIISLSTIRKREAFLEDFCVKTNSAEDAKAIFYKLNKVLKSSGFYSLLIVCTEDSEIYKYGIFDKKIMILEKIRGKVSNGLQKLMPRKIINNDLEVNDWDVSGIVLEGRI